MSKEAYRWGIWIPGSLRTHVRYTPYQTSGPPVHVIPLNTLNLHEQRPHQPPILCQGESIGYPELFPLIAAPVLLQEDRYYLHLLSLGSQRQSSYTPAPRSKGCKTSHHHVNVDSYGDHCKAHQQYWDPHFNSKSAHFLCFPDHFVHFGECNQV